MTIRPNSLCASSPSLSSVNSWPRYDAQLWCTIGLSETHLYLLACSTSPEPSWAPSQKREDSRVGEGVRQRSPLATAHLWVKCLCVHKTRLSICERLSCQQIGYFRLPSWIFDEDGSSIIRSSWEQCHSHFESRISRTNKKRSIAGSFGKQPGIFRHTWFCADFLPLAKIKIYCQISFTVVNFGSKERRL